MPAIWFWLLVAVLVGYVVLDGFDLGVGLIQPLVAKTDKERKLLSHSIGPVWDGNEVWLLAAGGTMVFAFPKLYALGISGLYLPINILLWLFTIRALGIELRHHDVHPLWSEAWGFGFWIASLLISLFLGVALGNVLRGVSFDADGSFLAPLWTDFTVGNKVGILDVYTVPVGILGVLMLALHGSLWLSHRVTGPVADRAQGLVSHVSTATLVLALVVSGVTMWVQPHVLSNLKLRPWGAVFPTIAIAAGAMLWLNVRRKNWRRAFQCSAALIASSLGSAAFGVFPDVLPGRGGDSPLTIENASNHATSLATGLAWWIPGMLLASGYAFFVFSKLPRTVSEADLEDHGETTENEEAG